MASKSAVVAGMQFGSEFLSNVCKHVLRLGGTAEMVFDAMKTDGDLAEIVAARIVSRATSALKSLNLIAENIQIATSSFTKDSFFRNGPVKLWFGDNFKNWVLPGIQSTISSFNLSLKQTKLTKAMLDSEILSELGDPKPFTPSEFAAIIRELISKQPQGEDGPLLTNGYANIFYVKLEDERVVAVCADWHFYYRLWSLNANDLDGRRWHGGHCVFS